MSTPICRCRVLYLGSAVPHITKDGLQGIQEPLRELYPDEGLVNTRGIDSWLSVWSNGLLLENVDEHGKRITRFFPVETLHYCAAVRHVGVPGAEGERVARFLPLDSPFARVPNAAHPPLFACILRRTTGIKVLECHAFVCKKEMGANALVRCCFHAYADNMYARRLENGGPPPTPSSLTPHLMHNGVVDHETNGDDGGSLYNSVDNDNHKVWVGTADRHSPLYSDVSPSTLRVNGRGGSEASRSRPRQMVSMSKLPPPPLTMVEDEHDNRHMNGQRHKERTHKKNNKSPVNGHGPPRQAKGPSPRGHVYQLPPPPPPHMIRGRPMPPFIVARSAEEPAYMPSARPLSPVASYQPLAFPYDRYYMHQYGGTQPRPAQFKKKRKGDKSGGVPGTGGSGRGVVDAEGDSKFSTGIYRKKGHLNERAFSYSIRQEHRSRSHSSLATLAFNGHGTDSPRPTPSHHPVGERELAQLVTEISLSEDETDEETTPVSATSR